MSVIPSCNHNWEQFKQYGALDHHLKETRESVNHGARPAAEQLHLGVDDDPDGGAVLLHLSRGSCWLDMINSLVEETSVMCTYIQKTYITMRSTTCINSEYVRQMTFWPRPESQTSKHLLTSRSYVLRERNIRTKIGLKIVETSYLVSGHTPVISWQTDLRFRRTLSVKLLLKALGSFCDALDVSIGLMAPLMRPRRSRGLGGC